MYLKLVSLFTAIVLATNFSFARPPQPPEVVVPLDANASISEPLTKAKAGSDFDVTDMLRPGKAGYFALSPAFKFVGPLFSEEKGSEYVKEVFGLLVQAANYIASEFSHPGYNDNFTYWAFLVAALVVPHHESKLMHARIATENLPGVPKCSADFNELGGAIGSASMRPVLETIYRQQSEPIFPNCSVVNKESQVEQVMLSKYNGCDMGCMQINAPTFREALMPEIYMNLNNTIRFGLFHLYSKFKDIHMNFQKYPCMVKEGLPGIKDVRPSFLYNLIRGTWGGGYNIGNTLPGSVCRFTNPAHEDYPYDEDFKKALDTLVLSDSSIYHKYLPEGTLERQALDEIVYNFRSAFTRSVEREKSASVQTVAQTDYFSKYLDRDNKNSVAANYYITIPTLVFRHGPTYDPKYVCGKIHSSGLKSKNPQPNVHVETEWQYNNYITGKNENWARVKISPFANGIEFTSKESFCYGKKRGDLYYVDANLVSKVESKDLSNADLVGVVSRNPVNPNIREFYSLDSSIIATVVAGSSLNIVEVATETIRVRSSDGSLKKRGVLWYKVLIPKGNGKFGWISEQSFDFVSERHL